jgi:uncharacterized repeat protein (TIGR03843 family)
VTGGPDPLRDGELTVRGRITDASNATLFCTAGTSDGASADAPAPGGAAQDLQDPQDPETAPAGIAGRFPGLACVYKPIAGERPLWDFPDGTLAAREVAAYEVSVATGWDLVPRTVLRDGPYGLGMVQEWVEAEDRLIPDLLRVFAGDGAVDGWCPVIEVGLADGTDGVLAHCDDARLRRIALFDAVINNADRKGGHLLPAPPDRVYAIDHGVSFHTEDKLRTLLWGFADRGLSAAERSDLKVLREDDALAETLTRLLTEPETAAFHARIDALLDTGALPSPEGRRRPIPWPPV